MANAEKHNIIKVSIKFNNQKRIVNPIYGSVQSLKAIEKYLKFKWSRKSKLYNIPLPLYDQLFLLLIVHIFRTFSN